VRVRVAGETKNHSSSGSLCSPIAIVDAVAGLESKLALTHSLPLGARFSRRAAAAVLFVRLHFTSTPLRTELFTITICITGLVQVKRVHITRLHRILPIPRLGLSESFIRLLLEVVRHGRVQRVVCVRRREECLYRYEHRPYLQSGRPFVLQDVQAYPPQLVYIRVVYLRQKAHLGRLHRVLLGQKKLQVVRTVLVRSAGWASHRDLEVPVVLRRRRTHHPLGKLRRELLRLLFYSLRNDCHCDE